MLSWRLPLTHACLQRHTCLQRLQEKTCSRATKILSGTSVSDTMSLEHLARARELHVTWSCHMRTSCRAATAAARSDRCCCACRSRCSYSLCTLSDGWRQLDSLQVQRQPGRANDDVATKSCTRCTSRWSTMCSSLRGSKRRMMQAAVYAGQRRGGRSKDVLVLAEECNIATLVQHAFRALVHACTATQTCSVHALLLGALPSSNAGVNVLRQNPL